MALDKVIDSAKHTAELKSIADSIRAKGKTTAQFKSATEMKQAVDNISTAKPEETYNRKYTANGKYPITPTSGKTINGGLIEVAVPSKVPVIKSKNIVANGTYNAADDGVDGYSPVVVNCPGKPEQEKTVEIVKNGTTEVTADEGKSMSKVFVKANVPTGDGLAPLSHPAWSENIELGKEAYSSKGNVITGTGTMMNVADINSDGVVDALDLAVLLMNYNKKGENISGDINHSGRVNIDDFNILLQNYNKSVRRDTGLVFGSLTEIPSISWNRQEVRPDGGEGTPAIYKLVGHVKSAHGVKTLLTALNFDNTVIQPVNAKTKSDVVYINEDPSGNAKFTVKGLLGDEWVKYTQEFSIYVSEKRSSVEFTQLTPEPADEVIDADYLEFYFRLADGKTWDDVNKSTFKFESLTGMGGLSVAIMDAKNNFWSYYASPYSVPTSNLSITFR